MKLRRNGRPDGRSKHASFQHWLREHAPLVYLGLYREPDDELATAAERRRRSELEELARIRRGRARSLLWEVDMEIFTPNDRHRRRGFL